MEKSVFVNIIKNYLKESKYLSLIKYNKSFQQILNISLENYKTYLSIEIELTLKEKLKKGKNNFICNNSNNIFLRKPTSYYHIYFDDNKEEIKKNYIKSSDKVNKIKIIIDREKHYIRGYRNRFVRNKKEENENVNNKEEKKEEKKSYYRIRKPFQNNNDEVQVSMGKVNVEENNEVNIPKRYHRRYRESKTSTTNNNQ